MTVNKGQVYQRHSDARLHATKVNPKTVNTKLLAIAGASKDRNRYSLLNYNE